MIILLIIASVSLLLLSSILILLVFLQNPKDQSGFGSISIGMRQMIGVAQTANVAEKATYILAGLIFALTLLISFNIHHSFGKKKEANPIRTQLEKYAKQKHRVKQTNPTKPSSTPSSHT